MLTDQEIDLIRETAEKVADLNVTATNMFYANLFDDTPEVRPLFPDDMFEQSEKLWASIVMVVESIEDLGEIVPALQALGKRHVAYGAQPEHYEAVCRVLVGTLGQVMAGSWSPEHQAVWEKALDIVSNVMQQGAAERAA